MLVLTLTNGLALIDYIEDKYYHTTIGLRKRANPGMGKCPGAGTPERVGSSLGGV